MLPANTTKHYWALVLSMFYFAVAIVVFGFTYITVRLTAEEIGGMSEDEIFYSFNSLLMFLPTIWLVISGLTAFYYHKQNKYNTAQARWSRLIMKLPAFFIPIGVLVFLLML